MLRNKGLVWLGCFMAVFCLFACEETEGENEYANWRDRNDAFIDSVAVVAQANADNCWKVFKAWNKPQDGATLGATYNTQDYVYVHVKEEGAGTVAPLYTDSVSVSYRGTMINGYVFDETYLTEELNPEIAGRVVLYLNSVVTGMTTALQYMHEGDVWTIYMPWSLAYEESANGSIPAYSDLIFEMYLAEINPDD